VHALRIAAPPFTESKFFFLKKNTHSAKIHLSLDVSAYAHDTTPMHDHATQTRAWTADAMSARDTRRLPAGEQAVFANERMTQERRMKMNMVM
jgi:hypothetical protein